jgi:myo-inositol-1(or 4)-monophosphatase
MCELAAGRVDSVFVLGLEEQDMQVGTLLLKEAGALMGTPDGKPTVNAESQLMAAGPRLYKALIKQLAPHF